jgi:hypothetical protein
VFIVKAIVIVTILFATVKGMYIRYIAAAVYNLRRSQALHVLVWGNIATKQFISIECSGEFFVQHLLQINSGTRSTEFSAANALL